MRKKSLGIILSILFLGAVIGSALGKLIGFLLPDGVVKEFFIRVLVTIGFDPVTLNIGIIDFTLGFHFAVNVTGIIGIILSAYLLKWYYSHRL